MYIGDKKIKQVKAGLVQFEDGTQKEYTKKQLSYLKTKESKTLTELRTLLLENIVPDITKTIQEGNMQDKNKIIDNILKVLSEHNVARGDFEAVLNGVVNEYNELIKVVRDSWDNAFKVSIGKKFGTYDKNLHPNYYLENIRMIDLLNN